MFLLYGLLVRCGLYEWKAKTLTIGACEKVVCVRVNRVEKRNNRGDYP